MARPPRILSGRLTLPAVGIALAAAAWLLPRSGNAGEPLGECRQASVFPRIAADQAAADGVGPPSQGNTNQPPSFPVSGCPVTMAPTGPRVFPQPENSPLLPRDELAERSEQLENIARQADRQIRHGFELAGRAAYFAARAEFITALRLVAQGLDAEHQTTSHSQSLAAGLTAIKEAEEFIPTGSRMEADLDLAGIIGSHRTPVLKNSDAAALTPMSALKCYFTFAQQQLAAAAGHEVAGSMALHGLGKLHAALAQNKTVSICSAESKAMTFYQAALLVCPQNYMAANDLGVLLAQNGNFAEARAVLEHSVAIRPGPAVWHNLAVVYQQLGQAELARQANWQANAVQHAPTARPATASPSASELVRWVDPQTFSQSSREGSSPGQQPVPAASPSPYAPSAPQPSQAATPALTRVPPSGAATATAGAMPWSVPDRRN
jgi:tetratricopeptide (TPR) repeat protein